MNALVLSGGNLKGSWQAGAIRAVLRSGFVPEIVTGISVGALNAAFLAAEQPSAPAGWPAVGAALADFWTERVTGPAVIATKRGTLDLIWRVLTNRWDGVVDTAPLAGLLARTFAGRFPRTGGLICRVGAVNLRTALMEYHGPEEPLFVEAVLASAAEPISMPLRRMGPDLYCDGGVVEITPLAEAIHQGATRIICIVCQPVRLTVDAGSWGKVLDLVGRETSIATTDIVANDLRVCGLVNSMVAAGLAPGKRRIEVSIIRPIAELPIDLAAFTSTDIEAMVQRGDEDAQRALTLAPTVPAL